MTCIRPIANRHALVDGTPGVEIYPDLAPAVGEHVIKKHRYSGFFGTDLDIIRTFDSATRHCFQLLGISSAFHLDP